MSATRAPLRRLLLTALLLTACAEDRPICFPAGTLVAGPLGPRAIEEVRSGDVVWGVSAEQGGVVHALVHDTWRFESAEFVRATLDTGASLVATPTHPVFDVSSQAFVEIGAMAKGAQVLTHGVDGVGTATVVDVAHFSTPSPAAVYDLSVSTESYFAAGVLVHNRTVYGCVPRVVSDSAAVVPMPLPAGTRSFERTIVYDRDIDTAKSTGAVMLHFVDGRVIIDGRVPTVFTSSTTMVVTMEMLEPGPRYHVAPTVYGAGCGNGQATVPSAEVWVSVM